MSISQRPLCAKCGAELAAFATEGFCSACLLERGLSSPTAVAPPPLSRFGDYELIEEIARGGMGVVYKARQVSLNRVVAVKMVLSGALARESDLQRFRAEAETAARLQHPNIVSIHEVGEHDGHPFFSMDFVEGRSLADLARDAALPGCQAAQYLKTIAEAVQYAHSRGVIHRDLKPSNILIDQAGQPRITDFGLAKLLADPQLSTQDPHLTLSGQVLGSPSFMPPEQATGKRAQVGPHSDIYSLGAVLYYLLTVRPPFAAETLTETLQQVVNTEPVSPRQLNPAVQQDLETICLKCLEKEPRHRYATAQHLTEDLSHFLHDEPIRARPIGTTNRLWRWCRRNSVVARFAGATAVLLLAVAVGSPIAAFRINRERKRAEENAKEQQQQRARFAGALAQLQIQKAEELFKAGKCGPALAYLADVLRDNPSHRAAAESILDVLTQRSFALPAMPPLRHLGPIVSAFFSQDGRWIVTASTDRTAQLWDAHTGQTVGAPMLHTDGVLFAAFSANGERVFTVARDHTVRWWNVETGEPMGPPLPVQGKFHTTYFSRDAEWFVTFDKDNVILCDARSGQSLVPPFVFSGVKAAIFSPDGRRLLTVDDSGGFQLWNVTSGRPLTQRVPGHATLSCAQFSPDAEWFVIGYQGSPAVKRFDSETGRSISTWEQPAEVSALGISPDGSWVVTGGKSGVGRIWDRDARVVGDSLPHEAEIVSVRFSPDRRYILTLVADKTIRLWTRTGQSLMEPLRVEGSVSSVQFSPDAKSLFVVVGDEVQLWDICVGHQFAGRYPTNGISSSRWFPELAEAVGGLRLNTQRLLENVPFEKAFRLRESLAAGPGPDQWAKWFFTDRIDPRPLSPYAFVAIGVVHEKLNRFDEAYQAFTKSIQAATNTALFASPALNDVLAEALLKRCKLLQRMGRPIEARADFLRSIPARDPQCPSGAVDLTDYYNAGLTEGWEHSKGNSLSGLQHGLRRLADVEFDVRGLIQLASAYTQREKFDFPQKVSQIKVRKAGRRLHFLHAAITGGGVHPEKQVGSYIIHLANHQKWEIPIVYVRDMLDWWWVPDGPQETKEAVVAWVGSNATAKYPLRLFKSTWACPLTDVEVESIDFVSSMAGPAPFLIAITLEP